MLQCISGCIFKVPDGVGSQFHKQAGYMRLDSAGRFRQHAAWPFRCLVGADKTKNPGAHSGSRRPRANEDLDSFFWLSRVEVYPKFL